jgi:hypothetical protein
MASLDRFLKKGVKKTVQVSQRKKSGPVFKESKQDGCHYLAAILFFYHSKIGTFGFRMVHWPKPFYKEKCHKNIIFMTKRSRLAKEKYVVRISNAFKNRTKNPSGLSPFENRIVRIYDVDCIWMFSLNNKSAYSQDPITGRPITGKS